MYPNGQSGDPNQWPAGQGQPGYHYQPGYQPPPPPGYVQPGYVQPGYPPAPTPPPRSGPSLQVWVIAGVAVLAMASVVAVALNVVSRAKGNQGAGPAASVTPSSSGSATRSAPPSGAPTNQRKTADPKTGLVVGSGPVRVDVYVDYQCPPCSTFEDATADVLNDYVSANRVTLSIHPVAFIDDRSKNKYATRAAAAAACAYEAGKLLAFHTYLLRNQPPEDTAGPTDTQLIAAGEGLGIGSGFDDCVSNRRKLDFVSQATAAAGSFGVSSVPAAYVNGRTVQVTRSALVSAVDAAP
jgi:protein-disulfide isomerase